MEVKIRASCLVKLDGNTAGDESDSAPRIWGSNLDLVIANMYVKTVYFFNHDGSSDFFSADVLKRSLKQALSVFYPMAGILSTDSDGRLEILCNGNGAMFVEASVDQDMEALGEFTPRASFLKLVPEEGGPSCPLVLMQMTRFRCGGVCLGTCIEHHVADGLSAVSFLNSWSDIARQKPLLHPPFFDRTCLKARSPPRPIFPHDEYLSLPQPRKRKSSEQRDAVEPAASQAVIRMFTLPKAFIRLLETGSATYSSYELLASHVWRCACVARGLSPEQNTKLIIAVDGRSRLKPPLPKGYFGNVIFTCCPILTAGEVVRGPIHAIAEKIRQSLHAMGDEYLRSAIDFLETQPDLSRFVKGSHTFASPNLGLTSWSKLPMYDCDFGWGRPAHVGPAHIPFEGLAYLLGTAADGDALRLCISLQARHMAKFSELVVTTLEPGAQVGRWLAGDMENKPETNGHQVEEEEEEEQATDRPAERGDIGGLAAATAIVEDVGSPIKQQLLQAANV